MAKKTKKEKILAEYHRKLQMLSVPQYKLPTEPKKTVAKISNYTVPAVSSVHPELQTDYSYVLSDLKRIALLAALAICAQLVLWYRLGSN